MAEIGTAIAAEVAPKVTESVYNFIGRKISYVFKYQGHIDELKEKVVELGDKREMVEVPVKLAIAQGDSIYEGVGKWLTRVDEFTKVVQPLIGDDSDEDKPKKRCFKGLCYNLTKRYGLGKKAVEAAKECTDLLSKGNFPVVSYRPNLPRIDSSIHVRDYEPIDSRKSNFQCIMEALKDPNINMIGVYGMGGVGKTTLVKEAAGQALKDKLFDTLVIAEVTQPPNYKEIREKFARDLGLEFDKETEVQRVDRIHDKLKKERRVLIILDNIWEEFKFETIGIPFGDIEKGSAQRKEYDDQRQCKILLTSRSQDVICKGMKIETHILVNPLSHEDAWHLFMTIVGDRAKESEFHDIAVEIVKKCGGLPVAIVTIANALKTEKLHAWKDTLDQIGSKPREIEGMDKNVCSIIELSYRRLKKEEAKLLFLLCGLHNAGSSIYINDLLKYSMGLGWFHNVDSLEKGRNRLYTLIDHLKASCLLLDGVINDTVKMHDIIHAVALSIASTDELMFNIQNVGDVKEVLEEKIPKDSTAISLPYGDICNELPEMLECPNLKLFFLFMENNSLQIPDHLFKVMRELKVLDLSNIHLLSLPSSLCCLQNLRTLCLDGCLLGDIAIVGKLRKLEILSMLHSDIELLPGEIGQLTRLKLLDLRDSSKLKVIAPNVISNLSRLEELFMDNSFIQWEIGGLINNRGRSNANLLELKQLSHLTTLHIHVQNLQFIPQDLFSEKLVSYRILIGDVWDWNWHANYGETSKMLKIKLNNGTSLIHQIKVLLKSTEELHLELNGVRNSIDKLDEDSFAQLKHLHLQNGLELSYVVNVVPSKIVFPKLGSLVLYNMSKLEKICHGKLHAESFSRLRITKVKKCDKLEHLFSFSMAKNLFQLEEIKVTDCKNLKEIFSKELEDHVYETERNSKIEFTQLRYLKLKCLPRFKSFGFNKKTNTRSREINAEDEPQDFIALFNQKVVFSRLETLKFSSVNIEKLWLNQPLEMPSYSQTLRSLTVEKCSGLKFLFPSSMVESLGQLQNLTVCYCDLMEGIIDTKTLEEKKMSEMNFPKLSHLRIIGLPKLTSFGTGHLVEFPSLNELYIESCSNLKTFFSNSPYADTMRKEPEEVNLENYLSDVHPLFDEKVAFPSLEIMILLNLDNLQLIWHNQLHANSFCKLKVVRVASCEKLMTIVPSNTQGLLTFQNLETLTVKNCWSMKSLFPVSIASGLLQLKELDISSCCLEEIVAAEEVEWPPRFVFPQLTYLQLKNLPNLKYFYQGLHTIEWPMLKHLDVYCCRKIKLYASEFPCFQKTDGESQPALFSFEKVVPNLKFLCLDAHNVTSISVDCILTQNFFKLKDLELAFFDDESVAFQFGFLQRLHHLESLALLDSRFMELFPYDQGHIWKQDSQADPFLQNLHTLEVWRCDHLKYLMPSSASFKYLTTLDTWRCDGLTNILACSTAKTLVQLTTMRIRECKLVTEIITNEIDRTEEEEIVFWQLKILELHCLSSLTYFCSANYAFKFPCLQQVIVSQCRKLKIFSQGVLSTPMLRSVQLTNQEDQEYLWKDDLNSTIQLMFADVVGFHNLEDLKLSEFPTLKEKIWNDQVPVDMFCKLKSLVVDEVLDMSRIIPYNVFCYLKNLESLEVTSCDSLEHVFDLEGLNANGHTLKKNHQDILGFNNLKLLKVHNCDSLRCILTPSIILGLVQLQEIEIKNCALIEEIIMKDGEQDVAIDKIMIPSLNSIILESLPNLTSFYTGSNILECPSLKTIIIKDCQNISMEDSSLHLASLFTGKVVLPNLEDLTLSSISTERIWHNQQLAASSCCQNLTILVIDGFDHLQYLFSSSMVKSLFQLKDLEICNCKFIEGVIVEDEGRTTKMLFPKLHRLKLKDLPRITRFCSSTGNFIELSSLFTLWIENCPSMKTFIYNSLCADMTSSKEHEEINAKENLHTQIQPLFDKKVRLPNLERLILVHVDELEKIWDYQLSLDSFGKLNRLWVHFCNKLQNIFPSNMLGRHQKLEMLAIENCDLVEDIFEVLEKSSCIAEEIVAKEEEVRRFVFSKLTLLHLKMLPSLNGLYPRAHTSKWPVLKELEVHGCDKVEIFASEFLSSQETHVECQQEILMHHPLFLVEKDAFCSLEELELCELPRLLHLWGEDSQPTSLYPNLKILKVLECGNLKNLWLPSLSFQNLMSLHISKCDRLRYLLPFSKAKTLVKLTSMNISDCKMMEQIITYLEEGEEVKLSIVFNKLDHLELYCLPSLTSFCYGDYTLKFPSLKKVIVKQCSKMETFSHGVLSTPKLQRLQLTKGEDEDEECWEGDLNSTIKHLFKKNVTESAEF